MISRLQFAMTRDKDKNDTIVNKIITNAPKFFPDWYINRRITIVPTEEPKTEETQHENNAGWNYIEW